MLGEFGARHHLAGTMHQVGEHLELVAGQRHEFAVASHPAAARVERERAEREHRRGQALRAAQQRSHAREQFFHVEGLGEVVVGARVDAGHFLVPEVAGGEQQHRCGNAGSTPALENGEAIDHRQAQVQYDGVIRLHAAQVQGLFTVGCCVHGIACVHHGLREVGAQVRLVLDNQYAHQRRSLRLSTSPLAASTCSLTSAPPRCSSFSS